MPEGPEIRLAADRVAKVLVGRPIAEVTFGLPALQRFERLLTGSTVTGVNTRGKAMLTRFDNGLTLYSHNQLYGRWYTTRRPSFPKTNRSLRVALHTERHSALLYSASDIEVLTDKQLSQHAFLGRIGPDILAPELTVEQVAMRLESDRFRNRALASLYLDQSFLAGIGNYLRSEILWAAGVEPSRKPADLSSAKRNRIARNTLQISRRSYRTRGVTVAPTLAARLKANGLTYRQRRFWVFGREGLSCHRCDTPIRRRSMGGRNIFVCSSCQPAD
ncbi:MAG: endonuclease VIII [Gammaproteobacteria bacterium]|nr:endonuclease VIII [Gammaproteobacteria bacterium]MDH3429541.1 endonuclease VIII [Gammaproteobacteria bacterium]MDH3434031.1 endonuclease VIII [Gammaproteobacteria bacterium]